MLLILLVFLFVIGFKWMLLAVIAEWHDGKFLSCQGKCPSLISTALVGWC